MDNFKVIYQILRHLEASMDCEETDMSAISAERLHISLERWQRILILMQTEGYIRGLVLAQSISDQKPRIAGDPLPEITCYGLEYLAENSFMRKAGNLLKGIKDATPGL